MQEAWDQAEVDALLADVEDVRAASEGTMLIVERQDDRLANVERFQWLTVGLICFFLGCWIYVRAREWLGSSWVS